MESYKTSQKRPPVSWNATTKTFNIFLEGILRDLGIKGKDNNLEIKFTAPITYLARIREAGTENWIIGIETPLTSCKFYDLKPNTEYEFEVRTKMGNKLSEPAIAKITTKSDGRLLFGDIY